MFNRSSYFRRIRGTLECIWNFFTVKDAADLDRFASIKLLAFRPTSLERFAFPDDCCEPGQRRGRCFRIIPYLLQCRNHVSEFLLMYRILVYE